MKIRKTPVFLAFLFILLLVLRVYFTFTFGGEDRFFSAKKIDPEIPDPVHVNAIICKNVVNLKPFEKGNEFYIPQTKKIYCFTEFINPEGKPILIKHVWWREGQRVFEFPFEFTSKHYRTFSVVSASNFEGPGRWDVDIVSSENELLKSTSFWIKDKKTKR